MRILGTLRALAFSRSGAGISADLVLLARTIALDVRLTPDRLARGPGTNLGVRVGAGPGALVVRSSGQQGKAELNEQCDTNRQATGRPFYEFGLQYGWGLLT
jgi:hypothetical protein